MNRTLPWHSMTEGHAKRAPLASGIAWGFLGGLAGTLVMDLVLMSAFSALGSPSTTCFSIVGDTVGRLFSIKGMGLGRSILLGILTHYLVGPLIGAIFGVLVARVAALRVNSLKKSIFLAILYVEILSQPLLATTPILMKMTVPATLQWYAGSFVVHMIVGVVLGAVVSRGLRQDSASRSNPRQIQ